MYTATRTSYTRPLTTLCHPRHSSRATLNNFASPLSTNYLQQPPQKSLRTQRHFSSTPSTHWKDFFPEPDAPSIKVTKAAWSHPVYTEEEVNKIAIAHREAKTWSDWTALTAVRALRWGLDLVTGYRHDHEVAKGRRAAVDARQPFAMSEKKYLIRNVFLETVAGVPGMVGGMLRHLHSMRRMKRDNGWLVVFENPFHPSRL